MFMDISLKKIQMATKHMKRCYTSYVFREMQIKTAVKYHHTPIRMTKIWNTENPKCWQECRATGTLIHCYWECRTVQSHWKTVWQFLTKLDILLSSDPATLLLGIYPKELKTYVHTKTCTEMFIAALSKITNT